MSDPTTDLPEYAKSLGLFMGDIRIESGWDLDSSIIHMNAGYVRYNFEFIADFYENSTSFKIIQYASNIGLQLITIHTSYDANNIIYNFQFINSNNLIARYHLLNEKNAQSHLWIEHRRVAAGTEVTCKDCGLVGEQNIIDKNIVYSKHNISCNEFKLRIMLK